MGIIATVVAAVATAGASLGIEGAIGLALQAAGTAIGSGISANQLGQAAEAATVPSPGAASSAPSTPSSVIPAGSGPFIPSAATLGPLGDQVPKLPPSLPGDRRLDPIPQLLGDHGLDLPLGGWLIDRLPESLEPLYNALDVSETPKPIDDIGNKPEEDIRSGRDKKKDREKKRHGSSKADKKFIQELIDDLRLTRSEREKLHRAISHKGFSEAEIRAIAEDIKHGSY